MVIFKKIQQDLVDSTRYNKIQKALRAFWVETPKGFEWCVHSIGCGHRCSTVYRVQYCFYTIECQCPCGHRDVCKDIGVQ